MGPEVTQNVRVLGKLPKLAISLPKISPRTESKLALNQLRPKLFIDLSDKKSILVGLDVKIMVIKITS